MRAPRKENANEEDNIGDTQSGQINVRRISFQISDQKSQERNNVSSCSWKNKTLIKEILRRPESFQGFFQNDKVVIFFLINSIYLGLIFINHVS